VRGLRGGGRRGWCEASRKNSLFFHTLGYESGNFQKSTFFHTQKVLFHTFNFFSYPQNCFQTFKLFFISRKKISYPYIKISYLMKIVSY
jgi:hypothetical protein